MKYKNKFILILIITLLISIYASLCVASKTYSLAASLAERQNYVSDEIYYVDTARRYLQIIFHVNLDFYKYSNRTSSDYFNLEHPPLGKYIIAIAMLTCGDKPLCWKLPSVVEASLIPLVLYAGFLARGLRSGRPVWLVGGALAALAAASDRVLYVDGSVAMLDIHLALFVALAIALGIAVGYKAGLVGGSVATTVKMSGLAAVGGAVLAMLLDALASRSVRAALRAVSMAVVLVIIVWIIVYLPLMDYFGPARLYSETINALRWHTTSRPPGPPTSTPLGWVFNSNPFVLSYSLVDAAARTTTVVEAAGLAAGLLLSGYALYSALMGRRLLWPVGSLTLVATYLMYAAIYAMGNHTFYSFYAVQLTPAAAASLGELLIHGLEGARGAWGRPDSGTGPG